MAYTPITFYNDVYINEFREETYHKLLGNPSLLEDLHKNHIARLDNLKPYYGSKDLLKESLDHYVTKRYMDEPTFRGSKEFQNYLDYLARLMYIDANELATNTFYVAFGAEIQSRLPKNVVSNEKRVIKTIDGVNRKLQAGKQLSQLELDVLSDYHAHKRDVTSTDYLSLIDYIQRNVIDNNSAYRMSGPVANALATFTASQATKEQTSGVDPASVRVVISDFTDSGKYLKYNSFHQGSAVYLRRGTFTEAKEKKIDKEVAANDLVEQTLYQTHRVRAFTASKSPNYSSNGMAYLINKLILGDGERPIRSQDTSQLDSYERAMRDTARYYHNNDPAKMAKYNGLVQEVHANRGVMLKTSAEGNTELGPISDIRKLNTVLKEHPELVTQYPMLKKMFNARGLVQPINFIFGANTWKDEYLCAQLKVFLSEGKLGPFLAHLEGNIVQVDRFTNLINNVYHALKNNLNILEEYKSQGIKPEVTLQVLKETLKEYSTARELLTRICHLTNSNDEVTKKATTYLDHLDKVMQATIEKSNLDQKDKVAVISSEERTMTPEAKAQVEAEKWKVVKAKPYMLTAKELEAMDPRARIDYYQTKKKEALQAGLDALAVMYINRINKENANMIRASKGM